MSVDQLEAKFPSESPYIFSGNSPIVMIDPNGKFKIPIHKAILKDALFEMRIDSKWSSDLDYGISIKADIYGGFSDYHFDSRPNFKLVDATWVSLNQQIDAKIDRLQILNDGFTDMKNPLYGIKRANRTEELGVLIHTAQDFYSHSNYVELYEEYFKFQNNGALPTEVPLYEDGVKIGGFKALMERTTKDKNGKYQGLYTGEFDKYENEFWDFIPNGKNKNKKDPNSHNNTNHDKAITTEGALAKGAAKREIKKYYLNLRPKSVIKRRINDRNLFIAIIKVLKEFNMYIFFLLGVPFIILVIFSFFIKVNKAKLAFNLRLLLFYFIVIFLYSIILGVFTNATNLEEYFYGRQFPSLILSKVSSYLILLFFFLNLFLFIVQLKKGKSITTK